ncbi:class I adenylate-forming enzyme family protein [Bacillus thuringiensis]|uniref:class I adenylate-forming enzyme family protein n=2 Tax=Bacillus cereus group TaxID=86661 RepID=UPI00159679E8|nr:class I adenylate-forming enzyme family protein [Bacillus thuringiensis]
MSIINELFVNGLTKPSKKALQHGNRILSYTQYITLIKNIGDKLLEIGIRKRDVIGYFVSDPFDFMVCSLAFNYIDAVIMPIDPNQGEKKLDSLINKYNINYIFSQKESILGENINNKINIESFNLFYKKVYESKSNVPDDVEFILLTSGTTSTPKAVMLTKKNILSTVSSIRNYLEIQNDDSVLLFKNLTHSSTFTGEFLLSVYSSITIYISKLLPSSKNIIYQMKQYNITILFTIPEMLKTLFSNDYTITKDLNLRIISCSGSMVSSDLIKELVTKNPQINFINAYGQTEASPRITYIESKDLREKSDSVGKPLPNVNVKIINNLGKECLPLEIGEIVVQGPNIMKGYLEDKEKTNSILKNGKLYTKDLGYMDKDGFLYITGRIDNMFIINGRNIHPEEVESVLLSDQSVKDCLVKKENNNVTAYITFKTECTPIKNKLLINCKNSLDYYKIPKKFFLTNEIKKNHNNKTIRNQVIREAEDITKLIFNMNDYIK